MAAAGAVAGHDESRTLVGERNGVLGDGEQH